MGLWQNGPVTNWYASLASKIARCEQDRLRQTVYRTAEKALSVAAQDLDAFLQHAPDCVSTDLTEYGLTRSTLLQPELFSGFTLAGNVLTNKAALDLLQFQLNEKQKSQFAAEWICKLLGLDMQPREIKSISRKLHVFNFKLKERRRKIQFDKKAPACALIEFYSKNFQEDLVLLDLSVEQNQMPTAIPNPTASAISPVPGVVEKLRDDLKAS
ncbi:hypothetical protein ElyMa_001613100 [Elysia marginata]|uniref:Uncharacterized protein n=1 Tax=Elysia marginata TaxID=1093978 RepID=A0AAV4JK60_9GAST|nr:hypothetical protein ElyMa_001613100 [Elysia marginata]